jgi:hypothetical protein
MCGCGMGGNNGNIESPNTPMMVIPNIFGGDIDSMSSSGIQDQDSESTYNPSGEVEDDND